MNDLKIDREQWRLFLKALGKTKNQVRLRSFFPKGHFLKDQDHGKKSHADLAWITQCQEEGRGVYVVINNGGDTDSSITDCKAFFYEHDDIPKSEQIDLWKSLGLPLPSIRVDTGGKSIHNYWILKKAIDPKTWKPIQERLLDYADADRSLKNPSRVMRLPGTHYMNKDGVGELTHIVDTSDKTYTLKEITDCLPTPKKAEEIKASYQFKEWKPQPIDVVEKALQRIPPRIPGSGTYHEYRNIFWGLIKACEEAGKDKYYAINLMQMNSPSWKGLDQIANSGGKDIQAGTFWYWAAKNGFKLKGKARVEFTVSVESGLVDPDEEVTVGGDPPQKLEAKQYLEMLRSWAKYKTNIETQEKVLVERKPQWPRYNIFSQQIEFTPPYGSQKGKMVACEGEYALDRVYLHLADQNYKISKEVAADCFVQAARENVYDPVKEYLENCLKGPSESIDILATTYLRPEDDLSDGPTIYDQMLKCTLIAAVARVYEPGCKFDNACVLMGKQGAKKSSFWMALGGDWFSDSLKDINGKDSLMTLHSAWISEFAEIDTMSTKKETGAVKAFLSQSTDIFRVPYGKTTEKFPRRGIVVGSTNRTENFLLDDTGSRRFWIIPTTCSIENPIASHEVKRTRDLIWAAAVRAYKDGHSYILDTETEVKINEKNERYHMENPWKNKISDYVNAPANLLEEFTTDQILTLVIEKPLERQTRYDQMQVAMILGDLGFTKRRGTVEGRRKWVYKRDVM